MKYLLLSLALFCIFIPMLSGEFQFDDHYNITQREGDGRNNHRILQNGINILLYKVYGTNPIPYHLVSLFFHIGVCCVLVALCEELGVNQWAVVLYAVHPVIAGTASYIIQSSVIMATFYCLLALLLYLQKRYVWCALSWIVACYCKEIAWQFPLVIFAWEWSARKRNPWMLGTVILGEIAGICYMFHVGAWDRWNLHFNMAERMATEGRVLFSYWGKILCPHTGNLTINADTIVTSDLFILYFFVLICLVAFMFSNRIWSFAILCFCFLNIGESTFMSLELAFEHRLYMPLAFMVPAFATIQISKRTFTAFLVWYLALCFWYQGLWRSEYKMWKHCVKLTPNCPRANMNYARQLASNREFGLALVYYRRGMKCYPKHGGCWQTWIQSDMNKHGAVFLADTFLFIKKHR